MDFAAPLLLFPAPFFTSQPLPPRFSYSSPDKMIARTAAASSGALRLSLRSSSMHTTQPLNSALTSSPAGSVRGMATVVERLNDLAATLPHKDAVMYHKQNNMKW